MEWLEIPSYISEQNTRSFHLIFLDPGYPQVSETTNKEGLTIMLPGGSDSKESTCNAGDPGSIPGSGRSPGEGHGNPLQRSCLENSMDRRDWWAPVCGVTESDTTE